MFGQVVNNNRDQLLTALRSSETEGLGGLRYKRPVIKHRSFEHGNLKRITLHLTQGFGLYSST